LGIHIGRVADNDVVTAARRYQPVALASVHTGVEPVVIDVALADGQRVGVDIGSIDFRLGEGVRAGNGETAAAGAQVEYAGDAIRVQPWGEADLDQFGHR